MSPKRAKRGGAVPEVSDAAVLGATGSDWDGWIRTLRHAGAAGWTHGQTARWLERERGLSGWWAQTVTVGFERVVLGREKHRKGQQFEVSGSKTLPVPIDRLWTAWSVPSERRRWLGDEARFEVRKGTENKTLRVTWVDGSTHVDVYFLDKGAGKSQVAVQHKKLTDAKAANREKAAWKRRLAALAELLVPGELGASSSGSRSRRKASKQNSKRTATKRTSKRTAAKPTAGKQATKKQSAKQKAAKQKATKKPVATQKAAGSRRTTDRPASKRATKAKRSAQRRR